MSWRSEIRPKKWGDGPPSSRHRTVKNETIVQQVVGGEPPPRIAARNRVAIPKCLVRSILAVEGGRSFYKSSIMIARFQTFQGLLIYCLKCHDSDDSQQALTLINEYLNDSRAGRPHDSFWSDYNVQQALGFRVAFIERLDAPATVVAEERHLGFCTAQLQYWLSAAADSSARLALARFRESDLEGGCEAAKEAVRLAGTLGLVSATVAEAAAEARKNRSS